MTQLMLPTWLYEWAVKGLLGFVAFGAWRWARRHFEELETLRGDVARLQKAAIIQHRALVRVAMRDRRLTDLLRRFLFTARRNATWTSAERSALERIQAEVDDLRERSYQAAQARARRERGIAQPAESEEDYEMPEILPPTILAPVDD